jgi:bacterial/archaeal transporter family protein
LTILLSVAFLGEALTIKTAAGAALILGGTLVLIL